MSFTLLNADGSVEMAETLYDYEGYAKGEKVASQGRDPIVLCSSRIRLALRRLLERRLPNITVLSFAEITPQVNVEAIGNIEVIVGNEAFHR